MEKRHEGVLRRLGSGPAIKIAVIVYASLASILIAATMFQFIATALSSHSNNPTLNYLAPVLACMLSVGTGMTILIMRKCRHCQSGPGKRITTALEKMGKGDLGWKITLRRHDNLSEVAMSVTRASESLADRIGKLQIQARQLIEVENFLIDSMEMERIYNPYTMKALRKLKICTNRLNANIEDFQVSASVPGNRITISRPEPEPVEAGKA